MPRELQIGETYRPRSDAYPVTIAAEISNPRRFVGILTHPGGTQSVRTYYPNGRETRHSDGSGDARPPGWSGNLAVEPEPGCDLWASVGNSAADVIAAKKIVECLYDLRLSACLAALKAVLPITLGEDPGNVKTRLLAKYIKENVL